MYKNEIGNRYGKLLVIGKSGRDIYGRLWKCKCDCGNVKIIRGLSLRAGKTKSCGCFNPRNEVHGFYGTPTWSCWSNMKDRCKNSNSLYYKNYGGRGIQVCKFLKGSVLNFISILGEKPKDKSLDRILVNGNYSCGQCDECKENNWKLNIRWATVKEQSRNKRCDNCESNALLALNLFGASL
ncbi:MAG TPA: hypothetical protein VF849_00025 [Blattabacteriaceae bacterium]